MHRLLLFLFLFCGLISFGQNSLLNTAFTWFGKVDRTAIDSYLKSNNYQFISETDSTKFHGVNYSLVKTENGTQPFIKLLLSDTALEFISLDTYGHKTDLSILKNARFKSIGTDINGNFITTTYDNGAFLIHEDYEAVGNPLGKGEIAYFRYRIFRKFGPFDKMNGEKVSFSADGTKISENYRNGLLDGERTFYFPNGTVKRTENYRAGRLNGIASDYNQQGKLIHSSTHSYHWKYGMEKWYNREGKLVKSLQWQRDIPVGTEKQTFNGTTIGSIPYVKGVKQGLAKVPVYEEELIDTLNAEPLGIETVNFENGMKTGKAACFRFGSNDTLYTAFYKAGKLDSIYTWYQQPMYSYYKNVPRFTKTFINGLEHGARTYVITAGPLKDSVYKIEPYKNGKLDGLVIQYYKKNEHKTPEFIPGEWVPNYSFETWQTGVKNGPFLFRQDSMTYSKGNYINGRLDGAYEEDMILEKKRFKITGAYQNGLKTGEWTTNNVFDSIVVSEYFDQNRKHGTSLKTIKGLKTEERFYKNDTLQRLRFYEPNSDYRYYVIDFHENSNSALVLVETFIEDTFNLHSYTFGISGNSNQDSLLIRFVRLIENESEATQSLNGPFVSSTPEYQKKGNYENGKLTGTITINHSDAELLELIMYQNGLITNYFYSKSQSSEPYSGTFISAVNGEHIAVKDGLRHGWCVEYDKSRKEIKRTKYVKGIVKKTVNS